MPLFETWTHQSKRRLFQFASFHLRRREVGGASDLFAPANARPCRAELICQTNRVYNGIPEPRNVWIIRPQFFMPVSDPITIHWFINELVYLWNIQKKKKKKKKKVYQIQNKHIFTKKIKMNH